MEDIKKIHYFLFSDIYWWPGEYRKVNISKGGKPFIPIQSFFMAEEYMNKILSDFYNTHFSENKIIEALVEVLDNLNYFHPFREGNGRVQHEVIRVLAAMKRYEAIISINTDDEIYNLYMDGTVHSDKGKLRELFKIILKKID